MRVSEGRTNADPHHPRAADGPERAQGRRPGLTDGPQVRRLLALQATAGNRAVGALVQGSLQRSPQSWAASTTGVVALAPGGGRTSLWPPVVAAVRDYGTLHVEDVKGRAATLTVLEKAVAAWEQNQSKSWYRSDLDTQKATAVASLKGLVAVERADIQQRMLALSAPEPAPAARTAAMAMNVPGGSRDVRFEAHLDEDTSDSEASSSPGRVDWAGIQELLERDGVRGLPPGVHLRAHLTKTRHLPAIDTQGLIPGRGSGIGLPEGGADPHHVYALDLTNPGATNAVGMEAGGGAVGLVSTEPGDRDVNYPSGGAVRYPTAAPPLRTLATARTAPQPPSTYSFPLPLTPRSTTSLADFVNAHLPPQQPMTQDEVVDAVNKAFLAHAPVTFATVLPPPRT